MKPNVPHLMVLGLHLMSRGFGWTTYTNPLSIWSWKVVAVGDYTNATTLKRVQRLIDDMQPETLILEAFEPPAKRSERHRLLYRAIIAYAVDQGVSVSVLNRKQVEWCFARVGARTRQEIAEAVARRSPELSRLLTKKRRAWDAEDLRMSVFCAAALVATHYALDADQLLKDLGSAT